VSASRAERLLALRELEIAALAEVNRAIAGAATGEQALQHLVERAAALIGADGAGIALLTAAGDALEVGPAFGILEAPPNRWLPLHGSITGRVVRTGSAEIVPDVELDPDHFPLAPEPMPTRSAIAVPLRTAADEVIGGLLVLRGGARPPFADEHRELLQRFADQAIIAVEQARLVCRLEEANRHREHFLATLSHELRTPLTGILLWTDILRGTPAARDATAAEALDVIAGSAELLQTMVNDLLELGRIQTGRLRLERFPADLREIARRSLATLPQRVGAHAAGLVLRAELDADVPPVAVDAGRIQQVLWNLLANAVKFTEPPGTITLRVLPHPAERAVAIEVEDTGVGIPEPLRAGIFDHFRQADPSSTRRHGGLGIGLTLARGLVEAHGGTIRLRSEVGAGSTFTVLLPLDPAAAPAGGGDVAAATDVVAARPRLILIAEDVADTRHALARILASRGYRVLEAGDGEQAVRMALVERPDAVLMDIAMPRTDGFRALERLRADPATAAIPVAALTARALAEDRRRVAAAGFDLMLAKPFRIQEVLDAVRTLLAGADAPA
jgi:diguanylate cyclase